MGTSTAQMAESTVEDLILDREIEAWFAEAHRLFTEARERVALGLPLAALSSLVAVPPLHSMIVERCSALMDEHAGAVAENDEVCQGMYL